MSKMRLEVITPQEVVYDDEVDMIVVRTIDGDRGIMPEHQSLVTGVDIGGVTIKADNEEYKLAVSTGYMEVRPDKATILVDTAEFADEIDIDRAKAAKERAEKRLQKKHENHINEKRAEISLRKAINRLHVSDYE